MIWALAEKAHEGGWRGPLIVLAIGVAVVVGLLLVKPKDRQ